MIPARSLLRPGALGLVTLLTLGTTGVRAQSTSGKELSLPLLPEEVSPAVHRSIERGLEFLKRQQREDGSFDSSGRWGGSGRRGRYGGANPTVMSALAGMAFLSGGSTLTRGPHAPQLRKITDYLLTRCVTRDGLLMNPYNGDYRPMYGHAFAMTYLANVYGQERDPERRKRIGEVLKKAIRLTADTQSYEGGWGYEPDFREDEGTLTVTQTQGLRACRDAGLLVPRGTIDSAVRYIENSTNSDGSVRYRTTSRRSNTRPGVTSAAVVTLWNAGRSDDPLYTRIFQYIERSITPRWELQAASSWHSVHHAEYVLYFLGQAKHLQGGVPWKAFYRRVSDQMVREQDGDGSWSGRDTGDYSNVYSTSIALIVLQLPYSRMPVYQR